MIGYVTQLPSRFMETGCRSVNLLVRRDFLWTGLLCVGDECEGISLFL